MKQNAVKRNGEKQGAGAKIANQNKKIRNDRYRPGSVGRMQNIL